MKFELIKINKKNVEIDKRIVFSVIFLFGLLVLSILAIYLIDIFAITDLSNVNDWSWARINLKSIIVILLMSNTMAFIFGFILKKLM